MNFLVALSAIMPTQGDQVLHITVCLRCTIVNVLLDSMVQFDTALQWPRRLVGLQILVQWKWQNMLYDIVVAIRSV